METLALRPSVRETHVLGGPSLGVRALGGLFLGVRALGMRALGVPCCLVLFDAPCRLFCRLFCRQFRRLLSLSGLSSALILFLFPALLLDLAPLPPSELLSS